MKTNLAEFIRDTREGREADAILRSCVHCGFCTATCPTYQLLGDELDGPRGRIYLIKQVLEGQQATTRTQTHLDRCLTCRNCESTCPSGVKYASLLEIGRKVVDRQVRRPPREQAVRAALRAVLPRRWLFTPLMRLAQTVRPLLPAPIAPKVTRYRPAGRLPTRTHARKMLLLDGCVQPGMAPNINAATARVLDALGIQAVTAPKAGCCGAIGLHLDDEAAALNAMRRNVDAWWPLVATDASSGVEAIVMTASGCGATVKDYGRLLAHDPAYAAKAARVSAMTLDLGEALLPFETELRRRLAGNGATRAAYHPPCSLQHGQQLRGGVERLLRAAGVDVHLCADSHLCCGSAGTYSVLQPDLAYRLRDAKLASLAATAPEVILSANIGCLTHLASGTGTPVEHWIELLDRRLHAAPLAQPMTETA